MNLSDTEVLIIAFKKSLEGKNENMTRPKINIFEKISELTKTFFLQKVIDPDGQTPGDGFG